MTTENELKLCSICNKPPVKYSCIGCKKYFCSKDFKEHEQQLSIKFDTEVVRSHNELYEQIQELEKSNYLSLDLFTKIEEWKKTTIDRVEQAAERAHHELIELIDKQRIKIRQQLESITKEIRCHQEEETFIEDDIDRLKQKLNEIQKTLQKFIRKVTNKTIIVDNDQIDWNRLIYIREKQPNLPLLRSAYLSANATWTRNGVTVAGADGGGSGMSQLCYPLGLCVDDDQNIYIADHANHRIVVWKCGATTGRIVAGGNGQGNQSDQLNSPYDMIVDKERNSLIICDYGNKRVVRWPRQNGSNGETIISNVACIGLTMDDNGFLYVVDNDEHEVRRYQIGESQGTVVAGGNGPGNQLDQLNCPRYVFVDRDRSVYVSDMINHRVMKWMEDAKQGIVVAGGQGQGNKLTQLSNPYGIVVDQSSRVYIADYSNHRIMHWTPEATQGSVIIGGNGSGSQSNQTFGPIGLSFDREGNLYTASLSLDENINISTQTTNFYATRNETNKINFARLEKGLLLFIYVYETAKENLAIEMALWDHRLCFYMIKDGKCTKPSGECHHEHQSTYRQTNLCSFWYINNSCTFGSKCKNSHNFEEVLKYHHFIRTETEMNVYKLIRFIRNFAGHYIDSAIKDSNDQQDLYKDIIVVMVHLVHILSPKQQNSIEHLNLFLETTTINQLIPQEDLLVELKKPYDVPEIFLDLGMNFNTYWYRRGVNKQCIDFNRLSSEFILFFNNIFTEYYEGRLKSRGAKAPWRENQRKT
ncbi:unnamed protein product [Rotaria sordida]|uniref:C3H1-type domain-containing protein n=1 Tax=Rotaria sordida TaxID=392033 RepID=A0A813RAI6_9BILA|nr:unnamed protein product [Rotaria sordida]